MVSAEKPAASSLDERMLARLVEEPRLALRRLARSPEEAPAIIPRLLRGPPLPAQDLETLLKAVSTDSVGPELRKQCAEAVLGWGATPHVRSFLEWLAEDAQADLTVAPLLLKLSAGEEVPEGLFRSWLTHPQAEVRAHAARQLVRSPRGRMRALEVLLEDGRTDLLEQAEQEEEDPRLLREMRAYLQLKRCADSPSAELIRDVLRVGQPIRWATIQGFSGQERWLRHQDLEPSPDRPFPQPYDITALTQRMFELMLQLGMDAELLPLLEDWQGFWRELLEPIAPSLLVRLARGAARQEPPRPGELADLLALALETHPPMARSRRQRAMSLEDEYRQAAHVLGSLRPEVNVQPLLEDPVARHHYPSRERYMGALCAHLRRTRPPEEIRHSFFETGAGRMLLSLLLLDDREGGKRLFWGWFQRFATQAERDAALHCIPVETDFLPEWIMQASADALVLYGLDEDEDVVHFLGGHREAPRLMRRLIHEARNPSSRASAAAYLLRHGEPVPPFEELEVQVHLVAWLERTVPGAVAQVEALLNADGDALCATEADLGRALYNAMHVAKVARNRALFQKAFTVWLLALGAHDGIEYSAAPSLRDHVPVDDKIKLRKVAEKLARLSPEQRKEALRGLPVPLATAWARSASTAFEVRVEAAWVALRGPDFNARDCDLSTDPRLLVALMERIDLRRGPGGERWSGPLEILRVLLRATVNLLVRSPPRSGDLEEQGQPYFRLRAMLREWMLGSDELGAGLAASLREDLVDRVKNALRAVHHQDDQLSVPLDQVNAWLRCSAVLRDVRLLEVVKNLGQHLNPQERAFLADPLESAKQEMVLPRLPDDVEVVVMAVRELRVP
jgi:hypothetical protein